MTQFQELESGERFVVNIARASLSPEDAVHWCALRIRAYQVDEHGQPSGVEIPAFTTTVALAALAEGQITIESVITEATAKATTQFKNFLAAQRALAGIP